MNLEKKKQEAEAYLQQLYEQQREVNGGIEQIRGRIQTYNELIEEKRLEDQSKGATVSDEDVVEGTVADEDKK